MAKRRDQLARIAQDALAIEQEEAQKAGTLGYMARVLVQTTMPHTDPKKPSQAAERKLPAVHGCG